MLFKYRHNSPRSLLVFLSIALLFYWCSQSYYFRIDLTKDGRYSLSKQSKQLLQNIHCDYEAIIYLGGDLPYGFYKLQQATLALIEELDRYSSYKISYRFVKVNAQDSKQIEHLSKRGLPYTNVNIKDKEGRLTQQLLFPALVLHNTKKEVVVALLKNNPGFSGQQNLNRSIANLEYELLNGLRMLERKQRPNIGFLEGHKELAAAHTIDFAKSLSENYNVKRISSSEIDSALKVLIIAKPRQDFTEKDKYSIDQYIMHGGKLLWLVDEVQVSKDSLRNKQSATAFYNPLNIEDQLFTYGIRINPQLVLDMNADLAKINTAARGEKAHFTPLPWAYEPLLETNPYHAITKGVLPVRAIFANSIDTIATPGIEKTTLLRTSSATRLENVPRLISMQEVQYMQTTDFYKHSHVAVSVLLEGIFPSVFQGRLAYTQLADFKSKSIPTKMIVIADGELIKNETRGAGKHMQFLPLGYNSDYKYLHGNKNFLLNAIDYLCDDAGWSELRNKEYVPSLLNKNKARNEREFWQVFNIVLPLLSILLVGFCYTFYRRRKYGR